MGSESPSPNCGRNFLQHSRKPGSFTISITISTRAVQYWLWRLIIIFTVAWCTLMITRLPDKDGGGDAFASALLQNEPEQRNKNSSLDNNNLTSLGNYTTTGAKVSRIFNDLCPVDYLGLTPRLVTICNSMEDENERKNCSSLTCRKLISGGNRKLYDYARDVMKKHDLYRESDTYFIDITRDCDTFLGARGYKKKMALKEDLDFPLAYNIIVHRSVEMIERLIYALYRPQNSFCIHMDAKAKPEFKQALTGIAKCLSPNVFISSKLERIIYGGFSRLQADLNCMHDHISNGRPWRYLLNTAGEAFPLRTQREMVQILRIYNGTNDVEGIYGHRLQGRRKYFENEFVEFVNTSQVGPTGKVNPPPPHDIDIVKGSVYVALNRGFVEFILKDQRAKDFLEWTSHTYSPDELFFATLNHRYANPHIRPPGSVRAYPSQSYFTAVYANWGSPQCQGKYIHYICINGVGDLPHLMTRHELFVNKFYADFEPMALDCMRAWLEHKDACPVQLDYEFYRQVAHRDDII